MLHVLQYGHIRILTRMLELQPLLFVLQEAQDDQLGALVQKYGADNNMVWSGCEGVIWPSYSLTLV